MLSIDKLTMVIGNGMKISGNMKNVREKMKDLNTI